MKSEVDEIVQDAAPGSEPRPTVPDDAMVTFSDAGKSVTVHTDTDVVEYKGHLWLHTSRLRGWAVAFAGGPYYGMIRADMAKQGREIPQWTAVEADAEWHRMFGG